MNGRGRRRPKKSETLQIRIPFETKEEFLEACETDGASASEILRRSILDYLSLRKRAPREKPDKPGENALPLIPRFLYRHRLKVALGALASLGVATLLPSAAAPDFHAVFSRLDSDGDGRLSPEEYFDRDGPVTEIKADAVIYRAETGDAVFLDYPASDPAENDRGLEILTSVPPPAASQRLSRRLDANADGKVDFAEYQTDQLFQLRLRFDDMDRNKDGRLTLEELTLKPIDVTGARSGAVLSADGEVTLGLPPQPAPGERTPAARADSNRDGIVTLDEYLASMR